jgi:uncharacterized protein YjiS (DUF1127 family)
MLHRNMRISVMAIFWDSVIHYATPAKLPAVFERVGRVLAWIGERRAQNATMRELQLMDERDLRDLRISPYDFESISHGTFRA